MQKTCLPILVLLACLFGGVARAQRIGGVPEPGFNPTDSGAPYFNDIFSACETVWPGQGGRLFVSQEKDYNYLNYTLASRYQQAKLVEIEPRSGARDTATKPLQRGFIRGMINDPQGRPVQIGSSDVYGSYDTLCLTKSYIRTSGTDEQVRRAWRGGRYAIPNAATGAFKAGLALSATPGRYLFWITNNPTDTAGAPTRTIIIQIDTIDFAEVSRVVIDVTQVEAAAYLPTAQATYFFGTYPGGSSQTYTSFSLDAAMQFGNSMNLPANIAHTYLAKAKSSNTILLAWQTASGAPTVSLLDMIGTPVAGFTETVLNSSGNCAFSYDGGVLRAASYDSTDWALRQYTLGANGGWATSRTSPLDRHWRAGKPLFYLPALSSWFCESGSIPFGTVNGYPDPVYRFLLHADGTVSHYGKPQGSTPYSYTAGGNISEGNGPLPRTQLLYQSNEFLHNGILSPNFSVLNHNGERDPAFTSSLVFPRNMIWQIGLSHAFFMPDSVNPYYPWRTVELATGNRILFPLTYYQYDRPGNIYFPDTLYRYNFDGTPAPTSQLVRGLGLFKLKAGGFATMAFFYPDGSRKGQQSYSYTGGQWASYNTAKAVIIRLDAAGDLVDTIAKVDLTSLPDSLTNRGRALGLVAEDDSGGIWFSSVLNSSLGADSIGRRSWMMRIVRGKRPAIVVLDSNYITNWGTLKIEVLPGKQYRFFGRLSRYAYRPTIYSTQAQVLLIDSVGHLLPDPEFATRIPYRFIDGYGNRGSADYSSIVSMLPDGRVLMSNYTGSNYSVLAVQRDGRMDPSFLPITAKGGVALRLLSNGKLLAFNRSITNTTLGLHPNMLGGVTKNGLSSFYLNISPLGKGFVGGKVERVPSPVIAANGCTPTGRRTPVSGALVKGGGRIAITDTGGRYALALDTGRYNLAQELPNDFLMRQICPLARASRPVHISRQLQSVLGQDFINESYDCPRMTLNFGQSRGRLCSKGLISVWYKNEGTATQPDARLRVFMPRELTIVSSAHAYTHEADGSYTFPLGDVASNKGGFFTIVDSIACVAPDTNLRICWSARIEPMSVCGQIASAQINWDGAWLDAKANYVQSGSHADQVRYRIVNRGADMADSVGAVLMSQNYYPAFSGKIKLHAGDSAVLYVQSGQTFTSQLFLQQTADCPLGTGGSVGFSGQGPTPTFLSLQDGWLGRQTVSGCFPLRYSFDPNEKTVYPEKVAEPGQMLDYTIHFENYGNDTAFSVIVVDTLDPALDVTKLVMTGSSHPCSLTLDGTEAQPVASFGFTPIKLSAKRQDSVASKGYVTFSVPLRPGVARGAYVANRASIYFDRNPAVVTAYATVQVRPLSTTTEARAQLVAKAALQVAPNPAQGRFSVTLPQGSARYGTAVEVRDAAGKVVANYPIAPGAPATVQGLAAGVYTVHVQGLKAERVVVTE